MKFSSVIFIALFGIAFAGKVKTLNKRYDGDYQHQSIVVEQPAYEVGELHEVHHYASEENKGFSAGSGLRSIAQGSADRASSAVLNQHAAAHQAAYVAKSTLAQSAIQAASTALAALAGKEVLVENLNHQASDAHRILDGEVGQLHLSKKSAGAAKQAAAQAGHHVSVLTAALNSAQAAAEHAERAANEAAAELASQTAMVGKAKGRLDSVSQKLHAAQIDFEATRDAASKATAAAEEAQSNADHAGAHASAQLNESAGHHIYGHESQIFLAPELVEEVHYKH